MLVPESACAENRNGIAVPADEARASQLLEYGEGGRSRFEQAVGTPAPRYAIIESEDGELGDELRDAIRAKRIEALLPWLCRKSGSVEMWHETDRCCAQMLAAIVTSSR